MKSIFATIATLFIYIIPICAQPSNDTLTLNQVLNRILETYPSIPQAEEAIRIAESNLSISKSTYLPSISGTASYLWLDPISKLDMNEKTIHINSHHNLTFGVSINQLIWDFGKNKSKVEESRIRKEIAQIQKRQTMQSLLVEGIRSYYQTAFARHSILIKTEQLNDYKKMLEQTGIKKDAGAATEYNYLNTNVSFSAVEAELIALNANKETQYVNLGLLADTLINDRTRLSLSFQESPENRSLDELLNIAYSNRPELLLAVKEYEMARQQEISAARIYNPELSASGSSGFKNGYEPSLGELRFNYSFGATLSIPLYMKGNRKHQISIARSDANKALQSIDLIKRNIIRGVSDNYYSLVSAAARILQLEFQVQLAERTYSQAEVNYKAGSITNLELLTTITNKSNSKLMLLQEKINFEITYYQLLQNIGVNISPLEQEP